MESRLNVVCHVSRFPFHNSSCIPTRTTKQLG
jgi:hypothetical protein